MVIIHVVVLWVLIPCGEVVGYRHFGGPCCFDFTLKMEAA